MVSWLQAGFFALGTDLRGLAYVCTVYLDYYALPAICLLLRSVDVARLIAGGRVKARAVAISSAAPRRPCVRIPCIKIVGESFISCVGFNCSSWRMLPDQIMYF